MRIDNSYLSGLGAGEVRPNTEASEAAQKSITKSASSASTPLHVPAPELDQLRQLLDSSLEVRPDVMARVALLMQSGYYNSPEAAEKTADSMIKAIE